MGYGKSRETFNLRVATISAIKAMQKVDVGITVKSEATGEYWDNVDEISKGDAFMNAFEAKQELFGKDEIRVIAYLTILSKFRLNILKFDADIFKYLQENKLYIKLDFFEQNNTVSPGIISSVHPLYIQREDLVKEIHDSIKKNGIPSNKITDNWKASNDTSSIDDEISTFRIITSTQKYGNGSERVETTVLKILCAEKDGLYL